MMTMRAQKLTLFTLVVFIFIAPLLVLPPAFAVQQSATLNIDLVSGGYVDGSGKFFITHPTFSISVNITPDVVNLTSVSFRLDFNDAGQDLLEWTGVEAGDLMSGALVLPAYSPTPLPSKLTVLVDMPGTQVVTGSGSVATITFKLKETALAGSLSGLILPSDQASASAYIGGTTQDIQITTEPAALEVFYLITTLTLSVPATATVEKPTTLSSTLKDGDGNPVPNKLVHYYRSIGAEWQEIDNATTDLGGISSISYTPTDVEPLTIKAEFKQDLKHAGSSDTATMTVNPISTTLTLDMPTSVKVHDTIALVATLKKDGSPMVGYTIDYYISSNGGWNPIGSDNTDTSGTASIDYTFDNTGIFEIKAEYAGTPKYIGSSDTATITVSLSGTTLTITVPTTATRADETVPLSATLKDENDNPLPGLTVDFYIYLDETWNEIESAPTNVNGIASITYVPTAGGIFEVMALYTGSLEYAMSSDTALITITIVKTTLTLSAPATAKVDTPIVITGNLKDDRQNPLPGSTVNYYIYIDGQWNRMGLASTDLNGDASLEYILIAAGTFQVKVEYNGTLKYDTSTDTATVVVNPIETMLTADSLTVTVYQPTLLNAYLKDENGEPIPDVRIAFYIYTNGKWNTINSTLTNTEGIASIEYTPTVAGTYQIKAIYDGSSKYTENISLATITVNPIITTLALTAPTTATLGKPTTITATLKDESGNPIANFPIRYYIYKNEEWTKIGSSVTDEQGNASLVYVLNNFGTYKLKAKYEATSNYLGSDSNEVTITVEAKNILNLSDLLIWFGIILIVSLCIVIPLWKLSKRYTPQSTSPKTRKRRARLTK